MAILAAFAIAGALSFLLTPLVKRMAERLNIIDRPDRGRKRHRRLVPLWGGLAIFIALVTAVGLTFGLLPSGPRLAAYQPWWGQRLWILLLASSLLTSMGLWDDKKSLPPKIKLLIQLVAASCVVLAGIRIESTVLPFSGQVCHWWPWLGSLVSVLWLIFLTNAFNFIDGLDGLATSQAIIAGAFLSLGAWFLGWRTTTLATQYQCYLASSLAAAAVGAALGFWRYNRYPARIFLGDAGSYLFGFTLSLAALLAIGQATSRGALFLVIFALGWPSLDAVLVVIRRLRRGEPISKADTQHLHHHLLQRGFTPTATVAFINLVAILLGVTGLIMAGL